MNSNNMQADVASKQVASECTDAKATLEVNQRKPKPIPEPTPMRVLGKGTESVRIMTDELQEEVDRLYDTELARLDQRRFVLIRLRELGHSDRIPKKLQQQITLLLGL